MTDHYYTEQPSVGHDRQIIEETIRNIKLKFVTDSGVFSKKGIDYGSKLLIEHIELPPSARILDVGCGYGPIGLFAASLADRGEVTMVDINERAVALAAENARLNHINNVEIRQSNLFANLGNQQYTTIITNPPIRAGKNVVHQIYEEALNHLVSGGQLWVVIQKKQGAPSTFQKLEALFYHAEEITKDKGYRIFKAIKK
jgi:16S rRNA (guanine1207-N2)-methyltransferase